MHETKKFFYKLKMDSSTFLKFVVPKLNSIFSKLDKSWIIKTANIYEKYSFFKNIKYEDASNIYSVVHKITNSLQSNSIVIVDGGTLLHYSNQSCVVKREQTWLTLSSLEENEFAIPASLGAYVHLSKKLIKRPIDVICYTEDLLKCMESLNFIDNNNIPINIHAIQRNYIQNGSEIKKIMYPHSVVINESKTINKDINYLENFKIIPTHQ
jgi:arsenate reductase-like glutaredoxin family protein